MEPPIVAFWFHLKYLERLVSCTPVLLQISSWRNSGSQRDTKHSRTKHMHNHSSLKPDHGGRLAGQTATKADHKNQEMENQHSFAFFDVLHAAFNNDSVSTESHIYVMLAWLPHGGLLLWLLSFSQNNQDFSTFWTTWPGSKQHFSPLPAKSLRLHNGMKSI